MGDGRHGEVVAGAHGAQRPRTPRRVRLRRVGHRAAPARQPRRVRAAAQEGARRGSGAGGVPPGETVPGHSRRPA